MTDETYTALRNYDWHVRNRGLNDTAIDWETDTFVYGDGGVMIDELCRKGFTPATRDE